MAKAYSMDLRERVVEAVGRDGLSCNQAAARFEVAISTAIDWVNRYRETGSVAPGQWRPPRQLWPSHACPALEQTERGAAQRARYIYLGKRHPYER